MALKLPDGVEKNGDEKSFLKENGWWKELICCGYKNKGGLSGVQGAIVAENEKQFEAIIKLLDKVPIMRRLSKRERADVAKVCEEIRFTENEEIIKEGDIGDAFFVINEGEATVSKMKDDERTIVVTLRRGDYFGENALLCDEPRIATVTANSLLTCLKVSRQHFRDLGLNAKLQFAKRKAVGGGAVRQIQTKPPAAKTAEDVKFIRDAMWRNENLQTMIGTLEHERLTELINVAWTEDVKGGSTVINAGDLDADFFYIVKSGSFEVSNRSEDLESTPSYGSPKRSKSLGEQPQGAEQALSRAMTPGDCFGELALLYLTPRTATVQASEDSVVWVIDRQNFKRVLMEKSDERIKEYVTMLDKVDILECLAKDEKKELANAFIEMTFTKGEYIVKEGEPGSTFFMLYEGEVEVTKDGKKIRDMKSGAFFGEKALIADEPRSATVTVTSEKVQALALDKESFDLLLGPLADLMKDYERNSMRNRGRSIMPRSTMIAPPKRLKHVPYENLDKVGLLGNGGFGCVELMKNKQTGDTYALKSMSKGHIVKVGMQSAVVNEKNVLLLADSPFIVRLYATYNFENTVCFLLELLLGGELYATYTRENFWGNETHARFYTAMVILAFEHLHSHRILYRDLKPENIVLTKDGLPKLVDMGLAKRVVGKTHTTCGTPDYFAPEVITAQGHNHAVDWWTVGILTYELLSGNPPFTAGAPMQIFKNVLGGIKKVTMPKRCQGDAGNLIKALLRKDASERLPMRSGGVANIKKHQWYSKFDWAVMEKAQMKVPFKPKISGDTDMKNFSAREEDIPRPVTYHDDGSGWDIEFEVA